MARDHFWAVMPLLMRSVDDEARVVEGTATTTATDLNGDIIESAGAIFKLPVPLLLQHDRSKPIGQVVFAKVSPREITIRGEIARKTNLQYIEDAWSQIRNGLVKGLSIGAQPLKAEPILSKDGRMTGTRYTAWRWIELSAVTLPMNESASIKTILAAVRDDFDRLKQRKHAALINGAIDALSGLAGGESEKARRIRLVAAALQAPHGGQRDELTASERAAHEEARAIAVAALAASARALGTPAGARAIEAAGRLHSVEAVSARVRADAQVALLRSRWMLEGRADFLALGKAASVLSPADFESHSEARARGRAALRSADQSMAASMARAAVALESAPPAVRYQVSRSRAVAALEAATRALASQ